MRGRDERGGGVWRSGGGRRQCCRHVSRLANNGILGILYSNANAKLGTLG